MMWPWFRTAAIALGCFTLTQGIVFADAVPTRIDGSPGHWNLLREGKPYFIKGAGGSGPAALLKEMGGNSLRTWGADDLGQRLDEAQRLGLTVCVGIWLGHENDHFNYNNADQVAEQYAKAKAAILKYKDHPAVLMWGIGNEMEGPTGENAAIWSAINNIAALAKQLDPNHPTMTVVAEIGGDKIKNINRLCPDIDVVGINSYGGAGSVAKRYKAAGGTKPYVLTEYGPIGPWEGGHTSYGAPIEPTSSEKAKFYESAYKNAITDAAGTCLGGYAFTWGAKQETTATWFGMLLADGSMTNAVAAVSAQWTGHPPAALPPEIQPIKLVGSDEVQPGQVIHASVQVSSPQQHPLTIDWQLHRETEVHGQGGSYEPPTKQFPDAITGRSGDEVTVKMPEKPGIYRLYVFAHDDQHYAATANVPLRVIGQAEEASKTSDASPADETPGLKRPVILYADDAPASGYIPSGWMGNTKAISLDPKCTKQPHTGATCLQCSYNAPDNFGGVVWQSPANNWGDQPGGRDLSGAKRIRFWARGEQGGERVEFKFGVLNGDQKFKDTASGGTTVTLTPEWKRYTIDLAGKDLSQILTGFCWVTAGHGAPITFYLDDIAFE